MLSNPVYDPFQILTKVYSEGAHLKQAIADTYIEELNRARTVRIVYGVTENDGYLSHCIRHFAPKAPKPAVRLILKISLYMLLYMDKKRYMVTDCAVELCKKLGKGGVAGFVNAFLRRFDRAEADRALPAGEEGEAIALSYPLYAWRKLKAEYGDRAAAIASARSAGVCVRFERNEEKYLSLPHIDTPFAHTYIFPRFARDEGYDAGDYTFQSVGSRAVCETVEPCKEMLDACAAPGGKSVLLAKKCGGVTAFELHPHRVELIRQYRERMGTANVFEKQKDSSVFDSAYAEKFDGVLCDVPCSGFGTLSENPRYPALSEGRGFCFAGGGAEGDPRRVRALRAAGRAPVLCHLLGVRGGKRPRRGGISRKKSGLFPRADGQSPAVRAQKIRFAVSAGRGVRRRFLRREAGEEMKGEA